MNDCDGSLNKVPPKYNTKQQAMQFITFFFLIGNVVIHSLSKLLVLHTKGNLHYILHVFAIRAGFDSASGVMVNLGHFEVHPFQE